MTTFTLPVPPTLSKTTNNVPGVGRVKSKEYKAWIKQAGQELMIQHPTRFYGSVQVHFIVPYNGRRDLDNYLKALLDALVRFEIIEGDTMKHLGLLTIGYEHHKTEVQIIVERFKINT